MSKKNRLTVFPSDEALRRLANLRFALYLGADLKALPTTTSVVEWLIHIAPLEEMQHDNVKKGTRANEGAAVCEAQPEGTKARSGKKVRRMRRNAQA